ncbi:pepsin-like aspartic protease [Parendozoicomonas haliclonae]|nr:pepsin-like aspartic protease [Parendozoicomonas haliclonae]
MQIFNQTAVNHTLGTNGINQHHNRSNSSVDVRDGHNNPIRPSLDGPKGIAKPKNYLPSQQTGKPQVGVDRGQFLINQLSRRTETGHAHERRPEYLHLTINKNPSANVPTHGNQQTSIIDIKTKRRQIKSRKHETKYKKWQSHQFEIKEELTEMASDFSDLSLDRDDGTNHQDSLYLQKKKKRKARGTLNPKASSDTAQTEMCEFPPMPEPTAGHRADEKSEYSHISEACKGTLTPTDYGEIEGELIGDSDVAFPRNGSIKLYTDWNYSPHLILAVGKTADGKPQQVKTILDTGSTYPLMAGKKSKHSKQVYVEDDSTTAHKTGIYFSGAYGLTKDSRSWSGHQVSDLLAFGEYEPHRRKFFVQDHGSNKGSVFGFDTQIGSGWNELKNTKGIGDSFWLTLCNSHLGEESVEFSGSLAFSEDAITNGGNQQTTPLYLESSYSKQFFSSGVIGSYPVELVDIEVNGTRFHDTCWKMNGYRMTMVDTGTPGLFLPEDMYQKTTQILKDHIRQLHNIKIHDDFFDKRSAQAVTLEQYKYIMNNLPSIRLGFRQKGGDAQGVWIEIPPQNYIWTTTATTLHGHLHSVYIYNALSAINPLMDPTLAGTAVLNGYRFHFDPENGRIGVAKAGCNSFSQEFSESLGVESYDIEGGRGSCTGPLAGSVLAIYAIGACACCSCCGCIGIACKKCLCKRKKKSSALQGDDQSLSINITTDENNNDESLPLLDENSSGLSDYQTIDRSESLPTLPPIHIEFGNGH